MADATPQFRLTLEALPPDAAATVGEVARAYLRARLAELEAVKAGSDAEHARVIEIKLTPHERNAIVHRLGLGANIAEVFADSDEMMHLAAEAEERADELCVGLEKTGTLTINGTELDAEIVREAIEGSTWNGVHADEGEVTPQRRTAARRALESAAQKIEAALGLEAGDFRIPEA
jgi:hypothetical protein